MLSTIPQFRIRCSQIGKIMTEPRTKGTGLSETCKSYCKEWLTGVLHESKKDFSNKYTRKGRAVEEAGIEFASHVLNWGMVFKNTERRSNDWLEGEADIVTRNFIADHKASWDEYTFPLWADEIPVKDYYWQLQGYMALWDKPVAHLVYTLQNAPPEIIEREAWIKCREYGLIEMDEEVYLQTRDRLTFGNRPDYLRIKSFTVHRDRDKQEQIKQRVMQCREYIHAELLPIIKQQQELYTAVTA